MFVRRFRNWGHGHFHFNCPFYLLCNLSLVAKRCLDQFQLLLLQLLHLLRERDPQDNAAPLSGRDKVRAYAVAERSAASPGISSARIALYLFLWCAIRLRCVSRSRAGASAPFKARPNGDVRDWVSHPLFTVHNRVRVSERSARARLRFEVSTSRLGMAQRNVVKQNITKTSGYCVAWCGVRGVAWPGVLCCAALCCACAVCDV